MLKKIYLGVALAATFSYGQLIGLTPAQLEKKIEQKVTVIDIRTPQEWKDTGVIPTSHKLMFFDNRGAYDIEKWVANFSKIVKDKNQPFVLICRSGNRTGQVGGFLAQKLGYKKVFDLKHGIKSWIKENRKVTK
jgi:rhodanese-related sulfurtransferase